MHYFADFDKTHRYDQSNTSSESAAVNLTRIGNGDTVWIQYYICAASCCFSCDNPTERHTRASTGTEETARKPWSKFGSAVVMSLTIAGFVAMMIYSEAERQAADAGISER
jgi:hypothetical protein